MSLRLDSRVLFKKKEERDIIIIVQDPMAEIETESSSCEWRSVESQGETWAGQRTESLSDL